MPDERATFPDAAEPVLDVAVERDATVSIRLEAAAERLDADTVLIYHCAVCGTLTEDRLCEQCHAAANELRALVQDFAERHAPVERRGDPAPAPVRVRIDADGPAADAVLPAVGSPVACATLNPPRG